VNLGPTVNHPGWDVAPGISADGLALFFQSDRPGGYGGQDIWMTTRTTTNDDWSAPVNLGPTLNTSSSEFTPSISADGLTLYFGARDSDRSGGYGGWDIWQAPIIPVVDLNGDGTVDSADMCIMVDHWGMDEPLCDIDPCRGVTA